MKTSELIKFLQGALEEHGDIEVFCVEGFHAWDESPVTKDFIKIREIDEFDVNEYNIPKGTQYLMIGGG